MSIPPDIPSELDLVRRCVQGEPGARDAFARSYGAVVRRAVEIVLAQGRGRAEPGDVENIVQQVFLDLFREDARKLGTFDGRSRLSTWLTVVGSRGALNAMTADPAGRLEREKKRGLVEALLRRPGPAASPIEMAVREEERERVRFALDRLPDRDQLLLRIVLQEEGAYAEAARILGVSSNSIGSLLERAKNRFRRLFDAENPAFGVKS